MRLAFSPLTALIRMHLKVKEEQEAVSMDWWGGATDDDRDGNWLWCHSQSPVGDFVWGDSAVSKSEQNSGYFGFSRSNYLGKDFPNHYGDGLGVICQK